MMENKTVVEIPTYQLIRVEELLAEKQDLHLLNEIDNFAKNNCGADRMDVMPNVVIWTFSTPELAIYFYNFAKNKFKNVNIRIIKSEYKKRKGNA